MSSKPRVYIIHDNPEWIPPLSAALTASGIPHEEWLLGERGFDLDAPPPEGVFWSRLSASAGSRGRAHAKDHGRALLRWLESWERIVVNGSAALELEVSKAAQHAALRRAGITVPVTAVAFCPREAVDRAETLALPLILKNNQGGKGLGVRRFDDRDALAAWGDEPSTSPDGIMLVQEFLHTRAPFITRAEFVGSEFLYAVRVDTSAGGFELCPADACAVGDGNEPFTVRDDLDGEHPLIRQLSAFLRHAGIRIAGVEFAETVDGRSVVYDINTNTNYNPAVEAGASRSGAAAVASYLGALLTTVVQEGTGAHVDVLV